MKKDSNPPTTIPLRGPLANLKCPYCSYIIIMEVEIPQKGCLVFHKCQKCQRLIRTPENECCVICAYSNKKCPVSKNLL